MVVDIGFNLPSHLAFADQHGREVRLDALRRGAPAVLFFMRASTCPICLRHVRALAGMGDELDRRNLQRIVVVPGEASDQERVRKAAGAGITVVGSAGVTAHTAIGLGKTLFMQHSGTVLVDAGGQVRYAKAAAMPINSFDAKELLAAVRTL